MPVSLQLNTIINETDLCGDNNNVNGATAAQDGKAGCLINRKVGSLDLTQSQSVVVPLGKKDPSPIIASQECDSLIDCQASVSLPRAAHHHHCECSKCTVL